MTTNETQREVKLVLKKEIHLPTAIFSVDKDRSEKRLFAACLDGGVYAVEIESGKYTLLAKHESYASGVRYIAKTDQVISAGYDGNLLWLSPNESKPLRTTKAHSFWSWKMRTSPNEQYVATVTGQYLAGGYKYEPLPEREPSVRVFDAVTGRSLWDFPHLPPVLSVTFSPNSRYLAAANMMGEVRVWDLESGKQVSSWTTPDFTSWGIIKSHHYIGGIYDLTFTPDGNEISVCGMGPMIDPMAGNGKQTWQRFAWKENPPRKVAQIRDADAGAGLMEVLKYHPDAKMFLMAGRLAQGKWNLALFDSGAGNLLHSIDAQMRITGATWLAEGKQIALGGATGQGKIKDGRYPDFGHIKIYDVQ